MQFSLLLLSLATTAFAAPFADAAPSADLVPRTNFKPATAKFFYDERCHYLASTLTWAADPTHQGVKHGGPWGSKAVSYVSSGEMTFWNVWGGKGERVTKPEMGQCITFNDGVYVSVDVMKRL